jgi:Flp pilus assembly protein TadD
MAASETSAAARAAALVREGRLDQAEAAYRALVNDAPGDAVARYNLGMLRLRAGDPADALACFERCRGSSAVVAELGIGRALLALGRPADAIGVLRQAAHTHAGRPDVQNALGVALERTGDLPAAETAFRAALAAHPTHAAALSNLYDLLGRQERADQAEQELDALHLRFPDDVAVTYKLAYVKAFLGRVAAADALLRTVIERVPDYADAWLNLGTFAQWRHDAADAIASFRRALALSADTTRAAGNLAHALLYAGHDDVGWRQYEARPLGTFGTHRLDDGRAWGPRWDGRPLPGRTLLLHGEGGFGDVLQFVRYAAPSRQRAGSVLLWLERQYQTLATLLARVPGVDRIVAAEDLVHADAHASLSSLPFLLGNDAATVPMPYLVPDPVRCAHWRERLARDGALRVGLAWRGGAGDDRFYGSLVDRRRSIAFAMLEPLFDVRGVRWYGLQKGPRADEWQHHRFAASLVDVTDALATFDDTAALVSALDLVVTVDTSVAHLAGGLGKPVWLLNRYDSCWRWGIDGTATHWYPSMRLFRQPAFGAWAPAIGALAAALRHEAERVGGRVDGGGDVALGMRG